MKLLWHSNAPYTSTGYGQQTALFVQRLREHYDITISAFYGLEGAVIPWKGLTVLPGMGQTYGNETISEHIAVLFKGPREGLVLTLEDVWVLDPEIWKNFNVCSWVPVDHDPAPGPVKGFFANSGAIPIAMSKFGQEQLAEFDPLYVPHGVDTEVYKPIPKDEAREATGLPADRFVVGMVAANKGEAPSRKSFVEAFLAFKEFQDDHPEAFLYLHTEATGRHGGINLPALLEDVGIDRKDVAWCDQYRALYFPYKGEQMARFYSAMDVLLSPSMGEGFGVPVVEAQACGTPVIVSDFSAQPELCGAGWKVSGRKFYTAIGSWQMMPDVESIIYALECAWRSEDMSKVARCFAERYDADLVATEYFLPALKEVEKRFADREPAPL